VKEFRGVRGFEHPGIASVDGGLAFAILGVETIRRPAWQHVSVSNESVGVESARALLVGREVSAVCFVRDYVELHFDGPIVRAISDPYGMWGCGGWRFPAGDAANAMRRYIGQTVDGFEFVAGRYAQLAFGEHSFTIPLDDESRWGPEAMHVVAVDDDGRTDSRHMLIW
jgi:hypothetical protein